MHGAVHTSSRWRRLYPRDCTRAEEMLEQEFEYVASELESFVGRLPAELESVVGQARILRRSPPIPACSASGSVGLGREVGGTEGEKGPRWEVRQRWAMVACRVAAGGGLRWLARGYQGSEQREERGKVHADVAAINWMFTSSGAPSRHPVRWVRAGCADAKFRPSGAK